MTDHDHEALARQYAELLAATLDSCGHLMLCGAFRPDDHCDYETCRQVRAAVRAAREAGLIDQPTEAP